MKTDLLDIRNCDCMDLMSEYSDNHFDLAIIDPPYGLKQNLARVKSRSKKAASAIQKDFTWDKKPPDTQYFKELMRVSKNQIIWGANHFISRIPFDSPCWIIWDKRTSGNFADCELAWTSFKTAVRKVTYTWAGMIQGSHGRKNFNEKKIHPTQKPIALYNWVLRNYAQDNDKILDTHMGSGGIAIACDSAGLNLVACEIDEDYYTIACERIKKIIKNEQSTARH